MYSRAVQINPDTATAYMLMGNLYFAEHNYEKAVELYKKVIEIEPANSNAFTILGNTYVMQKDLRSAISCYKQAIDIDNENDELKLIYIEIIQEFIKIREDNPNSDAA